MEEEKKQRELQQEVNVKMGKAKCVQRVNKPWKSLKQGEKTFHTF